MIGSPDQMVPVELLQMVLMKGVVGSSQDGVDQTRR